MTDEIRSTAYANRSADAARPEQASSENGKWYSGITWYQWTVLIVACAGWIFDVYEGQIFNITRNVMLSEILDGTDQSKVRQYGDFFLGIFLLGGTIGGIGFGMLADRFGRRLTMALTILFYSVFSGLTFFATSLGQVAVLRFLVAVGVGGEWAVAASLVSEVFPAKARSHASGIFHATSILGTWMAAIVGMLAGTHWRYVYLLGVLPALLVLWVRSSLREPDTWIERRTQIGASSMGRLQDLFRVACWRKLAVLGTLLAAVGLGTFWAITVAGQNITEELLIRNGMAKPEAIRNSQFAYGIVQTAGGGLGLLAFGPLSARFGRRATFMFYHLLAAVIVPITCFVPQTYSQLLVVLPIFGFFTLGIHAGYAIYFPELFPTKLRATGTSVCFNGGRTLAIPVLIFSGWLKGLPDIDLRWTLTWLSLLFLLGILIVWCMPETRGKALPE
ncbi:MFS transporter [Planctomicrobium sp. SH661]|uniref:MFS transporter n=1 Tax=Planctomicrobium sp. SH661 TaxID=3448124 RepID=UPI003F5BFD80